MNASEREVFNRMAPILFRASSSPVSISPRITNQPSSFGLGNRGATALVSFAFGINENLSRYEHIIGWARLGKLDHPQSCVCLSHTTTHRIIGMTY